MIKLTKEQIVLKTKELNTDLNNDIDFLYECYLDLYEAEEELVKSNINNSFNSPLLNDESAVVDYLLGEFIYYKENNNQEAINALKQDENFKTRLISNALDKFLTNSLSSSLLNTLACPIEISPSKISFLTSSGNFNKPNILVI